MSVYQFVAYDTLFMYLFIYSLSILFYLLRQPWRVWIPPPAEKDRFVNWNPSQDWPQSFFTGQDFIECWKKILIVIDRL